MKVCVTAFLISQTVVKKFVNLLVLLFVILIVKSANLLVKIVVKADVK